MLIQEGRGSILPNSTTTNHKALALWFVFYKRKMRNRILEEKAQGMLLTKCTLSLFPPLSQCYNTFS